MANIENYQDVTSQFSGFPTSVVNRINPMEPTLDVINPYVGQMKDYADAKINVTATLSADESSVIATTETTFGFDEESNEYRIAYVVLEDNVGPYNQRNGLSNATGEEYLSEWFGQSGQVSILHNNVARGIYPETKGLKGSVPTKIKAGETYKYEYTFKLPSNIQDKKNIRIVTLLIDQGTGEIINADQFNFGKSSTGITSLIYDESKPFDVYSISGQKIKTKVNSLKDLPNGIYIINGRKVIINNL